MLVSLEQQKSPYTNYTPLELIRAGIVTERMEEIPLDHVRLEASLVDDSHVGELASSMAKERGQVIPIGTRAVEFDEAAWYDIFDGFHRSAGRRRMGMLTVKSNVLYGCSDEELMDQRILAASSVRSVQFPRIVDWINRAYVTTEWHNRGLSVAQAFGIAMNDVTTSRLFGLTKEDTEEVKVWVRDKCDRWGRGMAQTANILRISENADPEIVKQVRTASGGKDRIGRITPGRLEAVVSKFGGEIYFPIQRLILDYVVDRRLSAGETSNLVEKLEQYIYPGVPIASVEEAMMEIGPAFKPDSIFATNFPEESEDEFSAGPSLAALQEIEQEDGSDVSTNGKKPKGRKIGDYSLNAVSFRPHDDEESKSQRIHDLEKALEAANKLIESEDKGSSEWWNIWPELSPTERRVMSRTFSDIESLNVVGAEEKMTLNQVVLHIQSAFAKRKMILGSRIEDGSE